VACMRKATVLRTGTLRAAVPRIIIPRTAVRGHCVFSVYELCTDNCGLAACGCFPPLVTAAMRLIALRKALALASTLSVETPRPR